MENNKEQKIDLDYYEKVIIYNSLFNSEYLGSIIDFIDESLFSDKDIKAVIGIIKDFYVRRSEVPTLAEIKAYLDDSKLKESFKNVVVKLNELENVKFNRDELFQNTELFLKEKSVYNTLLEEIGRAHV